MKQLTSFSCSTEAFEGPLDLLLYLAQKEEIDIHNISLSHICKQFADFLEVPFHESELFDVGADSLAHAGALLLFKSRHLLPLSLTPEDEEEQPFSFALGSASSLLDYIKVKFAAKLIKEEELNQAKRTFRGLPPLKLPPPPPRPLASVNTEELNLAFQRILESAPRKPLSSIQGEKWFIADKILYIKELIRQLTTIKLKELFLPLLSREEYIVSFLAILECMKQGDISILRDEESGTLYLQQQEERSYE